MLKYGRTLRILSRIPPPIIDVKYPQTVIVFFRPFENVTFYSEIRRKYSPNNRPENYLEISVETPISWCSSRNGTNGETRGNQIGLSTFQVPMGANKKELLEQLDQVPTYVQQLQFTVKMPTVGKSATFSKVDSVINETKTLMNVISKVVTTCFVCATKVCTRTKASRGGKIAHSCRRPPLIPFYKPTADDVKNDPSSPL